MSLRGSKSVRSKVARKGRKMRGSHGGAERGTGETTGKVGLREGRCAARMRESLDAKGLENVLVRWVERQQRSIFARRGSAIEPKKDNGKSENKNGDNNDDDDDTASTVTTTSSTTGTTTTTTTTITTTTTTTTTAATVVAAKVAVAAAAAMACCEPTVLLRKASGLMLSNNGTSSRDILASSIAMPDWIRKWQQRYRTTRTRSKSEKPAPPPPPTTTCSEKVDAIDSSSLTASTITTVTHAPIENLKTVLEGYDYSRIYLAHVSFLDWRDLPGRRLENGERIWVVGAADQVGRHRTRLLVTGRHWRPRCLTRVNMITQPVVYAGGGTGSLTPDLFLWWFHHEFATTAMAMHPDGAILVAEKAHYLPPENECVTADGLVRLFVIPDDCLEPELVSVELRIRLAASVLSGACMTGDSVNDYVRKFTLKEAFVSLHQAWLSVRSETFVRSWFLLHNHGDTPQHLSAGPTMSMRSHRLSDQNDDRMLIGELQSLAHDAGLEINDVELEKWILDEEIKFARHVKRELVQESEGVTKGDEDKQNSEGENEDDNDGPTAEEAVKLLSRVLVWMEREPLDPGLLLAVRSMRDTATFMASKMGLAGTHPSGLPFFCPNGDHLTQPPPAHMGIPPYGALDAGKAAAAAGEYWPPHGPPPHPTHWKRLLAAAASTGQPHFATHSHTHSRTPNFRKSSLS